MTTKIIDTTAPIFPTIYTVAGDDKIDASEKSAGVTIIGTAEPSSTVLLTLSYDDVIGEMYEIISSDEVATDGETEVVADSAPSLNEIIEVPVDADGNWSYALALEDYQDGILTVTVAARDAAGNTGKSTQKTVVVQTTAGDWASITEFNETNSNDGFIDAPETGITLNLPQGITFFKYLAGANLNDTTSAEFVLQNAVSNLPAGLNARLTVADDLTSATLALGGQATAHEKIDSANVKVSFLPTYFTTANDNALKTLTPELAAKTFSINFDDGAKLVADKMFFTESAKNNSEVKEDIQLTLKNDTFIATGDQSSLVEIGNGLTGTLEITDETHAILRVSGTAVDESVATAASISLGAELFTSGKAPVGTTTFGVNFITPSLTWSAKNVGNLVENGFNDDEQDGFTNQALTLTLRDVEFVTTGLDLTKFVQAPAGITDYKLEVTSPTEATFTFSGTAVAADNFENIQINLPTVVFDSRVEFVERNSVISLTSSAIAKKIGDAKNNTLTGADKNDNLSGLAGNDTLLGKAGDDRLNGGVGKDSLTGGLGFDSLTGEIGADKFIFTSIKDAPLSRTNIEIITDFNHKEGDKIDLSAIDANADIPANQKFTKPTIGAEFSGEFTKAGQLFFETSTHILYGNVNKDGAADFAIQLNGVTNLVASDFVL